MSNSIDERIVQIEFDNKKFEDNVSESLKTLDKLKKATEFKGSTKGFEDLEKSISALSLANIEAGVKSLTDRFSTLGIVGMAALQKITNQAIDAGEKLVRSLTIDQVTAGWDKYADKTSAVQTIMAATAKDFSDTGEQMDYVNRQLDKLNWFTDETSYNFLDMVSSIGKFTSNNVGLETSVTAMQGISTWAAISGANANEASRAMYNLAQAIAVGEVKLIDWKSIENANMATAEFKETVINTAVELGTLKKQADGTFTTLKGHTVSVSDFNSYLSEGWFSSAVLLKALDQYGSFADKLYIANQKTGTTASEFLGILDDYQNGALDLEKTAASLRISSEDLESILTDMSDDTYQLGNRAFRAAQEAKTFGEAISSVKDAVSTGWMNTFELIFGNYQEAKVLWTDLAEGLYNVFAEGGNERNQLLKEWRAIERVAEDTGDAVMVYEDGAKAVVILGQAVETLDGRDVLIEGVTNALSALVSIIDAVKYAFQSIFPPMTASRLFDLTVKFRDFTARVKDALNFVHEFTSEEVREGEQVSLLHDEYTEMSKPIEYLVRILKGLFAAGKIVISAFKAIGGAIIGAFSSAKPLLNSVFEFVAGIADRVVELKDDLEEKNWYNTALGSLSAIFLTIANAAQKAGSRIKQFGEFLKDKLDESGLLEKIQKGFTDLSAKISEKLPSIISKIGAFFSGILDWVEESDIIQKGLQKIGAVFDWISGVAVDAWNWGKQFFTDLWDYVQNNEDIQKWFSSATETVQGFGTAIGDFIQKVANAISKFFKRENVNGEDAVEDLEDQLSPFEKISSWFKTVLENLKTNWANVSEWFTDITSKIKEAFSGFFENVGNYFQKFKDKTGDLDISSIFWGIVKGLAALAGIKFLSGFGSIGKQLRKGLESIAGGLKLFGKGEVQKDSIGTTFLKIAGAIAILVASIGVLTALDPERLKDAFKVIGLLGIGLASILSVLAAVNKLTNKGITQLGNAFLKIGSGIVMLVGSIWILSKIDDEEFKNGFLKLASILGIIGAFDIAVRKFGGKGTSKTDYLKLGLGVLALVGSLKWIATMSLGDMLKGVIGLGAVLFMLTKTLTAINGKSFKTVSSGKLIVLAGAIFVLAIAFKKVSKLTGGETLKGIVAFAAIIGTVFGIIEAIGVASKNKIKWETIGTILLSLATLWASMEIMTRGLKKLEGFDGPDILRTMTGFSEFITAIGVMTAGMGFAVKQVGFGNLILGGLALVLSEFMQVGLVALVGWIDELSDGNFGANITRGAELIKTTSEALNSFIEGAGGLLLLGSVGVGAIFSASPEIAAGTFLAGLIADLLILGSVITVDLAGVIDDYFTGDSNVSMIDRGSEVLKKTSEALKNFIGATDVDTFGEGLEYAATGIAVLVGSVLELATQLVADIGALIGTSILGLIGSSEGWVQSIDRGAGAVITVGNAIGGFFGAVTGSYKGQTLESLSSHLPNFGTNLNTFTSGLQDFDQDLVDKAVYVGEVFSKLEGSLSPQNGIWQFLTGEQNLGDFGTRIGEFGDGLKRFAESLDNGNLKKVKKTVEAAQSIIDLADSAKGFDATSYWNLEGALSVVATNGYQSFSSIFNDEEGTMVIVGSNFIQNLIDGIAEKLADLKTKGEEGMKTFIEGLSSQSQKVGTTSRSIGLVVVTNISSPLSSLYMVGYNGITGFLNGFSSRLKEVRSAAAAIGNATVAGVMASLDEHSPSRRLYEVADLGIVGYINSLHHGLSAVSSASYDIGEQTVLSLEEALSQLNSLVDEDVAFQPTITPVFDMSNLGSAVDEMDNAFYMNRGIDLTNAGAFSRNAEAVSDAAIKMGSSVNNTAVVEAIGALGGRIDTLNNSILSMKVVLDSGQTVGALAPSFDRALGQRSNYKERGN